MIGDETENKRIDENFSRAFEVKMSFSFCAPNEENEIEGEDEKWGVVL